MRFALVMEHRTAGGGQRIVTDMARYWAGRGHELTLITFGESRDDAYRVPASVRCVDLHIRAEGRLSRIVVLPRRVSAIRRVLERARPDVVISRLPRANMLTLFACLGLDVPVLTCEGNHFPVVPAPWYFRLVRRFLYGRRLDAFVVQSAQSITDAARLVGRERVYVVPNFLNTLVSQGEDRLGASAWRRLPTPPEGRVVAVARLTTQKAFDILLPAFARATSSRSGWGLMVLGDGPLRADLEDLARSLGVADRVWFAGWVDDPTPTVRDSTIFAFSSRAEGFPNALLEGMACGVATIANDAPTGPSDIVTDGVNGLLVPVDDVDAMARALGRLMDEPMLREKLAAAAVDVRDRYSIDRVMPMWERVVDAVLERRRAAAASSQR